MRTHDSNHGDSAAAVDQFFFYFDSVHSNSPIFLLIEQESIQIQETDGPEE